MRGPVGPVAGARGADGRGWSGQPSEAHQWPAARVGGWRQQDLADGRRRGAQGRSAVGAQGVGGRRGAGEQGGGGVQGSRGAAGCGGADLGAISAPKSVGLFYP
ncbi:hypothetical protein GUJ93_ZPchr0001g29449 [Zizania palustris]|uniref:Uncharacterized protein n=1 Tax=Zizania palustris TaxID=103762 RepID=A0A8J5RFR6_ZIZPA|nr:hypothetical protein GUJ93_ZPchr0001g29449 [Zizania palustris]